MSQISEKTTFSLPIVAAMLSAVTTGSFGVAYLANKMDRQDRRLFRIEKKLGIVSEPGPSESGEAVAAER
jgi:hypothetical protein